MKTSPSMSWKLDDKHRWRVWRWTRSQSEIEGTGRIGHVDGYSAKLIFDPPHQRGDLFFAFIGGSKIEFSCKQGQLPPHQLRSSEKIHQTSSLILLPAFETSIQSDLHSANSVLGPPNAQNPPIVTEVLHMAQRRRRPPTSGTSTYHIQYSKVLPAFPTN
jgi:hypothetical protein